MFLVFVLFVRPDYVYYVCTWPGFPQFQIGHSSQIFAYILMGR